jgi:uncharacterized repeat protein (TIGR03803 family)
LRHILLYQRSLTGNHGKREIVVIVRGEDHPAFFSLTAIAPGSEKQDTRLLPGVQARPSLWSTSFEHGEEVNPMQSKEQFCNSLFRTISRAATVTLAIAFVLAFMATQAAMFAGTAYAQTVTFTLNLQCGESCPPFNLQIISAIGETASDLVPIATVNSSVPGYTNPVPINGGSLSWASSPATIAWIDPNDHPAGGFTNPGGSGSIIGSVFGLPNGSVLLTGSFQSGAASGCIDLPCFPWFKGPIDISYINPVILANLGMAGLPNHGTGFLSDSNSWYYGYDSVSVTFTPGPQCASGLGSSARQLPGQNAKHSAGTANNFRILHNFSASGDGALPMGPLSLDQAGNLYGTAQQGGSGSGTVFRLKQAQSSWVLNPLYTFSGGNDGAYPVAGVTIGPNGILYGTTYWQGADDLGTVFNLRPATQAHRTALEGWSETVLHSFAGGADGVYPYSNLVFDQAGNLYGTTVTSGPYEGGPGVVFQLTPNGLGGWTDNVIYSFNGGNDGQNPFAGVVFDRQGNLYGTTWAGGTPNCRYQPGCGTVFQLTPSGNGWKENVLYRFQNASDGANPAGGLIVDASGNLYGTTTAGTVFELSPSSGNWNFTLLYSWGNIAYGGPYGDLAMDQAGNLYGTTQQAGPYGYGSVFKLTPSNGSWTKTDLYDFSGPDGANPWGGVTLDSHGNLFGTTAYGGAYSCGIAYEITP